MTHDLIVIGAGSAGLTAAGGAARFGLKVALVEHGAMGGECLNTGCVPSKALLAAAARAQAVRAGGYGVGAGAPDVDFAGVMAHVHGAIAALAPTDSPERMTGMGVEVRRCAARFIGPDTLLAGNHRLSAPRIVIATGSRPARPPIAGLGDVPYLTNETLWGLRTLPAHLVILGGGAIGMEMAQAFVRLGARVTVVEARTPLGHEDSDAAALVCDALRREGVTILADAAVERAGGEDGAIRLDLADGRRIDGTHLLVATGRAANVDTLDLGQAGVETGEDGIVVDRARRTSNPRIYAIGDCRAGPRFTHAAGYEGSQVALRIALGVPTRIDYAALPRVTYTAPELAQIGQTEAEARAAGGRVSTACTDFAHNDRAQTEGDTAGFCKLVHRGRTLVGATIVGAGAGDLLLPIAQAMGRNGSGRASTFALASAIVPYPTRSDITKATAFAAWEPWVFSAAPRRWAGLLAKGRSWTM